MNLCALPIQRIYINRKLNNDKEIAESERTSKRTLKPGKRLILCYILIVQQKIRRGP